MATTIGTSTNLLVVSIASDLGLPQMSVFHFTPIVLIAGLIALPYVWLVMPRLLRDNSVVVTHEPRKFRAIMRIGGGSGFIGRRTSDFGKALPAEFSLLDETDRPVAVNDRLPVMGTHAALDRKSVV